MSAWVGIGRSDIGLVRAMNQDAFVTMDHLGFWAVADGMGGHAGGEVAAQAAIATAAAPSWLLARNASARPSATKITPTFSMVE